MSVRIQNRAPHHAPRALTLIEMLIGMAITLVMMAAVVNLFANIGAGVRFRRAGMEMNGQIRITRARLFKDLAGATSAARPKLPSDDHSDGYLEIIEGQWSDASPTGITLDLATSQVPGSNLPPTPLTEGDVTDGFGLGDYDDILALTVRSESEPFTGRRKVLRTGGIATDPSDWIDETIQSNLAEVIWYSVENPADGSLGEPGMRTVYRRVLLIAPWVGPIDLAAIPTSGGPAIVSGNAHRFFQRFDISARFDPTLNQWVPNTLNDLTKRENRFAHFFDNTALNKGFPHVMRIDRLSNFSQVIATDSPLHPFGEPWFKPVEAFDDPERQGEDIMLSNVLAFDLRVFDLGAPLLSTAGVTLEPSDAAWVAPTITTNILGYGSYVDLGWGPSYPANAIADKVPAASFQERHLAGWHPNNPTTLLGYPAVYDTWPYHYEDDGIDQDSFSDNGTGIDQGTNALDDDVTGGGAENGTDDPSEREAPPPYDIPLRGIQVKLRIYETDSRQIREATVTKNFVPN